MVQVRQVRMGVHQGQVVVLVRVRHRRLTGRVLVAVVVVVGVAVLVADLMVAVLMLVALPEKHEGAGHHQKA